VDIIVTLKQVPDPEAPKETFRIDETDKKILNPPNIDPVINGYDENAIEAALQLKEAAGGKIVAVSMGEEGAKRALKQAMAMGVDEGVLLQDDAFADADATSTAYVLARAIEKIGSYGLILCGRQASDWDQSQVPSGIAELLGLPSVTAAREPLWWSWRAPATARVHRVTGRRRAPRCWAFGRSWRRVSSCCTART